MQAKLFKNFQRISVELGLYIKNCIARPLTSGRHMTMQIARMRGESLDSIAKKFNTADQ